MTEPKPCPMMGAVGDELVTERATIDGAGGWRVRCLNCGMCGPTVRDRDSADSLAAAVIDWNNLADRVADRNSTIVDALRSLADDIDEGRV